MPEIIELKKKLKKSRYEHVLRVKDQALKLAEIHHVDLEKASLAAIFHDCAKGNEKYYMEKYFREFTECASLIEDPTLLSEHLIHGVLGFIVAKMEYHIHDIDVLHAIMYHSTGRVEMTNLEKVIYLADKTERQRDFQGVEEIRKKALEDLDEAILLSIDQTIQYLVQKKECISINTMKLRNKLLEELRNGRDK